MRTVYMLVAILYPCLATGQVEQFGATANPTGSPIGGGTGYLHLVTSYDYLVTDAQGLTSTLAQAQAGDVIYVDDAASIDMTALTGTIIPGGVTLASGRGQGTLPGALIYCDQAAFNYNMFETGGTGVRVTGLRLRGPDPEIGTNPHVPPHANGVHSWNDDLEVDNCEIWAWTYSAVKVRNCSNGYVHHNYIHHCRRTGLGYGANTERADNLLVEANIFDHNRHDVTGAGYSNESYEVRYNIVLGHGTSHTFDQHGGRDRGDGTNIAGDWIRIHHNTVYVESGQHAVVIRGVPVQQADVHHNWFLHNSLGSAAAYSGFIINNRWVLDGYDEPYNVYFFRNLYGAGQSFDVGWAPATVWVDESSASTSVSEGGSTDTYSVVLLQMPTDDVSVTLSNDVNQLVPSLSGVVFTSNNWSQVREIMIAAVDDELYETDPHTGMMHHAVSSADTNYDGLAIYALTVLIEENEIDVWSLRNQRRSVMPTGRERLEAPVS